MRFVGGGSNWSQETSCVSGPWHRPIKKLVCALSYLLIFTLLYKVYPLKHSFCVTLVSYHIFGQRSLRSVFMSRLFLCLSYWFGFVALYVCSFKISYCIWPEGGAVGWGTALQAGRTRVRFSMVSMEFLIDIILPAALWTLSRLRF